MKPGNFHADLRPLVPDLPVDYAWDDVDAGRQVMEEMSAAAREGADLSGATWSDTEIQPHPCAAGPAPPVRIRVYRPTAAATAPLPAIVTIHGGGFAFGSIETDHVHSVELCAATGAIVVSVEYRRAPEHRFPAAIDDCDAALTWLFESCDGVDRARVAVFGESAGGCIAASLVQHRCERGDPPLVLQVLSIPVLDHRLNTRSAHLAVDTPIWNRPSAERSWQAYLGDDLANPPPGASPGLTDDLGRLPPTFISAMQHDPVRDEALAYVVRLLAHGVEVEFHLYPGTFHGASLFRQTSIGRRIIDDAHSALRTAFGHSAAP